MDAATKIGVPQIFLLIFKQLKIKRILHIQHLQLIMITLTKTVPTQATGVLCVFYNT